MILVDTSVWVDHLRSADARLAELLNQGLVLSHRFVIGELALGNLRQRDLILTDLQSLPHAPLARDDEVMLLIEREGLAGHGLGYLDVHLLASTLLTPEAQLWTRDRRLAETASSLRVSV